MNIFYNKTTLNDTLIISPSNDINDYITIKNNDSVVFYKDDVIVGINILNVSKKYNLQEGRLLFDSQIDSILKSELSNDDYKKIIKYDSGFKVGQIIEIEPIEGTHLNKCVVDIKSKKLQIVCGAANARLNLKVIVATLNTIMNNGMFIKPGKLMGNESFGMLCSYKELGIFNSPELKGIAELNETFEIGSYFNKSYSNV